MFILSVRPKQVTDPLEMMPRPCDKRRELLGIAGECTVSNVVDK